MRSDARSDPAPGSEKPWIQNVSPWAIPGREALLLSPHCRTCRSPGRRGERPPGSGSEHPRDSILSSNTYRCSIVQPVPPYSTGQPGTDQPRVRCRIRVHSSMSARSGRKPMAPRRAMSAGRCSRRKSRTCCRNTSISGLTLKSIVSLLCTRRDPGRRRGTPSSSAGIRRGRPGRRCRPKPLCL